jgi:hypothetical protein
MKEKEIKQLLERYWQCETSLEEEQLLQTFFLGSNLPEDLKIYQPLFVRTNKQIGIKASKDLVTRVNKPFRPFFYPALKIAASILLLLTIGVGFFTRYQQEKQIDKLFSDTYANPEEAVRETEQVVARISSVLQMIYEKNIWNKIPDSLQIEESGDVHSQDIELHK